MRVEQVKAPFSAGNKLICSVDVTPSFGFVRGRGVLQVFVDRRCVLCMCQSVRRSDGCSLPGPGWKTQHPSGISDRASVGSHLSEHCPHLYLPPHAPANYSVLSQMSPSPACCSSPSTVSAHRCPLLAAGLWMLLPPAASQAQLQGPGTSR